MTERSRWPFLSLIPLGLGAWAPIYAGVKARRPLWTGLGVVWSLLVVAGFAHDAIGGHSGNDNLAGLFLILGWVGGAATSFTIRSAYDRQMALPLTAAAEAGQMRLSERERARQIARQNPALAREMGIGRPDRPGASDAGLVDVNNASVTALMQLPGLDGDLATRIIETRERTNGFSSLEDMGSVMDLDGDRVDALRALTVFLPRLG